MALNLPKAFPKENEWSAYNWRQRINSNGRSDPREREREFRWLKTLRLEIARPFYTVVSLVSQPLSECEAEVDLVLIQTSFLFL